MSSVDPASSTTASNASVGVEASEAGSVLLRPSSPIDVVASFVEELDPVQHAAAVEKLSRSNDSNDADILKAKLASGALAGDDDKSDEDGHSDEDGDDPDDIGTDTEMLPDVDEDVLARFGMQPVEIPVPILESAPESSVAKKGWVPQAIMPDDEPEPAEEASSEPEAFLSLAIATSPRPTAARSVPPASQTIRTPFVPVAISDETTGLLARAKEHSLIWAALAGIILGAGLAILIYHFSNRGG